MSVTFYSYAVISITSSISLSNCSKLIGSEAIFRSAQLFCALGSLGFLYVEVFANDYGRTYGRTEGQTLLSRCEDASKKSHSDTDRGRQGETQLSTGTLTEDLKGNRSNRSESKAKDKYEE